MRNFGLHLLASTTPRAVRQGCGRQHTVLPRGNSGQRAFCQQAALIASALYASLGHWAPNNPDKRATRPTTRLRPRMRAGGGLKRCLSDKTGAELAQHGKGLRPARGAHLDVSNEQGHQALAPAIKAALAAKQGACRTTAQRRLCRRVYQDLKNTSC